MTFNPVVISTKKEKPEWYKGTAIYARPEMRKSALQLLNTLVPYILLLALMVYTVRSGYPYGITLLLGTAAAALYSRIFIFFHDCTHGSFLPSPKWNRNLGYLLGILTFTPFHDWRRTHAAHHITAGDLDRRGFGDITTMTVQEYLQAPLLKRLYYRLYRHPLIMFGLGPGYYFLLRNRFTTEGARKDDHISVLATNAAIGAIMVATGLTLGFKTYFAVQLPIVLMAATLGIWLFYIQHQFQGVYWARHEEWDPWQVVMTGASYYKLPKPLQWITGNIGFHHVHHMRPGIPNYTLEKCYREVPQLQQIEPLTIRKSLHSLRLHLYDEENRKMVSFKEVRQQRRRER